jgi:NAD(P)-dependent dehydrogenase (short-subunit alcohol dehydrogenase family)
MAAKPIILITRGNQGLGYETLKVLVRTKRNHLVVTTRSQKRSDEAIKVIASDTPSHLVDFTLLVINLDNDVLVGTLY